MSSLLYFFPGAKAAGRAHFEAAGLAYALEGAEGGGACAATSRGPSGGPGVVVAPPSPRGRQALPQAAESARWSEIPGGKAWVGFMPDDPPRPEDLARKRQLGGYQVELSDERHWLVPVARMIDGSTPLPMALEWDGSAFASKSIMPRYREIFAHACRVFDEFVALATKANEGAEVEGSTDGALVAVQALALNYRLGPFEVGLLGLLDTRTKFEVLKALVDWRAVEEIAGKADGATR